MKTKFIVASTMGVLGITSMVVGAISLADYEYSGYRIASKEPI